MFYFCNHNNYSYYWFLEEDVFIPKIHTIYNIDQTYNDIDILSPSHKKNIGKDLNDWHWPNIKSHHNNKFLFNPPFYSTMSCGIRLSNRMLVAIQEFVEQYKTLGYHEYFYNTLAMKKRYRVLAIPELSTIIYRHDWKIADIKTSNLYHPIKNIDFQKKIRSHFNIKK
jgi:hypothetical protein